MDEPIKLTKAECLPIMRAAFERGEMQAQKERRAGFNACLYAGPCVVGVCVPVDRRDELDASPPDTAIRKLFENDLIDVDDVDWFEAAQTLHDKAVGCELHERAETLDALRTFLFTET